MADTQDHKIGNPVHDPVAKRRHVRVNKACPMRYRILHLEEMPYRGRASNISGGGICFRSEFHIGKGKTVALELDLPKGRMLAIGKIRWTKKTGDSEYENGVEFLLMKHQEEETRDSESLDSIVESIRNEGISSTRKAY